MMDAGMVSPAKVTRTALENAVIVAAVMVTTESLVADAPEETPAPAVAGGDMYD